MNGLEMVRALIDRGYAPHQAAALAGHFLQESGGNPSALNEKEGAFGLSQWRLDRRTNLENFAKSQGKDPSDPNTQLDFIKVEMSGPEKKAGAGFLAAPDVATASAALKPYIRFGDDSAGTRLGNAQNLYSQFNSGSVPVGALASGAPPAAVPAAAAIPGAPASPPGAPLDITPTAPVGTLAQAAAGGLTPEALKGLSDKLTGAGQKQEEFAPLQQLQMPQSNFGQSAQIAAALAKAYGIGA